MKVLGRIAKFFRSMRNTPQEEVSVTAIGDTIEQCPHVASGEREVAASIVVSPSVERDVCNECHTTIVHKTSSVQRGTIILVPNHPQPKDKFFKPRSAYSKQLWDQRQKPDRKFKPDDSSE